jgi:tetratricopeptide (TPR) repeat protein
MPTLPRPTTNCGITYYGKGEFDRAIADYTEAIRLDPDYAEAYYNRSSSPFPKYVVPRASRYAGKGELELAIADYTATIMRMRPMVSGNLS